MKLAEDIWLGSVAARNNLMAAANYSAAFYGNAAVQSWSLGLTAPQVFWSAMARAFDQPPGNADNAPVVVAPVLTVVKTPVVEPVVVVDKIDTPVEAPVAAVAETEAPATAPVVTKVTPTSATEVATPLLLDEPRDGTADDLKLVKGIGAKLEAGLNEIGIFHFDQIAGLDQAGIDWLDEHLAGFKRSCARFDLVSGARTFL